MHDGTSGLWWRAPKRSAGQRMVSTINAFAEDQAPRRELAKERLSAYLARPVDSLTSESYYKYKRDGGLRHGFVRNVVDTSTAKLFAKQRPKPSMQSINGTYRERVQARRYSRFMEGLQYAPQFPYADTWELCEQIGQDAQIFEAGVVKVYADGGDERIVHERCFAHDMFVDPSDARGGNPRCLYHFYTINRDLLAERLDSADMLTSSVEKAIMRSSLHEVHRRETPGAGSDDLITVYEGWRRNGRHVIAVNGSDGVAIVDEEWKGRRFPFAFLLWNRNAFGFWSTPAVDEIRHSQDQANMFLNYMLENARLGSGGFMFAGPDWEEADLEANTPFKILRSDNPNSSPPQVHMPPLFAPQMREVYELLKGASYELHGTSQMAAQGRKESSIESGVALRTMHDIQTERHIRQARAYEHLFKTIGELDIECVQDLVDQGKKVKAFIPDERFLETIDFSELDIDTDQFTCRVQLSSATEDTIAARKQTIAEFAQAGYITPDVAEQALADPNADLEHLTGRETAQRRYIERIVAKFEAYDAEKDDRGDVYEAPDPLLFMPSAIMQMTDAYIVMLADDAPEDNKRLVRDWIAQATAEHQKKMQPPAPPPGAQPPGGPPGPGMPMQQPPPGPMPMQGQQPMAA